MVGSRISDAETLSASNSKTNLPPVGTPYDISGVDSQPQRVKSLQPLSRTSSNNVNAHEKQEDDAEMAAKDVETARGQPEKDPFEVLWDGVDSDPLNPRNMPKYRKWIVVLIISASSLCV